MTNKTHKILNIELSDCDDSDDNELTESARMLDLAFIMDCTGSMQCYIDAVKDGIEDIVDSIGQYDIRMALVEFRDHPPEASSFVTRSHDFTCSQKTMRQWLCEAEAGEGGDYPEAVADGFRAALRDLSWRENATKMAVIVTDSIPHGLCPEKDDQFKMGCPKGYDPVRLVQRMADNKITLYCVGCEPCVSPYRDFYKALALKAGGRYVPLKRSHLLKDVIVGGVSEELAMSCLADDIEDQVQDQISSLKDQVESGQLDMDQLVEKLENNLNIKGKTVTRFQVSANSSKIAITEDVRLMAKCNDLQSLRGIFKPQMVERRARRRRRSGSYSPCCRRSRRGRSCSCSPSRRSLSRTRLASRSRSRSPRRFFCRSRSRSLSRCRSRSRSPRRFSRRSCSRSLSRCRSRSRSPRRFSRRSRSRSLSRCRSRSDMRIYSYRRSSRSRNRVRISMSRSRSRSRSPEYCMVESAVDSVLVKSVVEKILKRI